MKFGVQSAVSDRMGCVFVIHISSRQGSGKSKEFRDQAGTGRHSLLGEKVCCKTGSREVSYESYDCLPVRGPLAFDTYQFLVESQRFDGG